MSRKTADVINTPLSLNDWMFAYQVNLAMDDLQDERDDLLLVPIYLDDESGIVIRDKISDKEFSHIGKDGNPRVKEIHRSRFKNKNDYPLTLLVPYNLSGNHFEIAKITLSDRNNASEVVIYNAYNDDYPLLKAIIESSLEINLPTSPTRTHDVNSEERIGCADGRCGDAVIAIARIIVEGQLPTYENLAKEYEISEELTGSELFDEVRKKHFAEGFIEEKTKSEEISDAETEIQSDEDSAKPNEEKLNPAVKKSFDKENYDDSTDEETSKKILKQKNKVYKKKLLKKNTIDPEQKELVLLALHQEGLKILYSQAVNDVYYGKEGLKHRFLTPSGDKKVYDIFKKDLTEVLKEVMLNIGKYIIDKDKEKIDEEDLGLLIDSIFSQDKEFGGFGSRIDSFIEDLKNNNGYHKLSSLKRESSSSSRVSGSSDDEKHIKDFSEELESFLKEFIKFVEIKANAKKFTFTFVSSQNEKHKDLKDILKNASKAIKEIAKKLSARTLLPRSFETGDIKNSAEFLSYVRLFNRSQNRQIKNLQDKSSEPLYSTQIIDHRLIKFAQQYEASESHNITYNEEAKKFGRSDEVERMGAYTFIKDCIEDLKKNIRSIYKVALSDAIIAQWIRSCLDGKAINLNIKDISHEHREEVLTLISGITYLIFGTETARNPASLVTQQMMLDMLINPNAKIQDSQGNLRHYNFQDFFGHKEKKKKGQDAIVIQGLMPMSPPGATAAARILNEKYSKFAEGEFKFNYKYPGPHKSGVKNPISADDLEDLEYNFVKMWLQSRLGTKFKESTIYEQFQTEIEKAKSQWYSKDLSKIAEEDLTEKMQKSGIKDKEKTVSKSSNYLKATESSKARQVTPDSSTYASPSSSPRKSMKKFGVEKESSHKKGK